MEEAEKYLLEEYKQSLAKPVYIKIGNKDYVVPCAYAIYGKTTLQAKKLFLRDFFDYQTKDVERYNQAQLKPRTIIWHKDKYDLQMVVPFALRNSEMSDEEILQHILDKAENKYKNAVHLTKQICKLNPQINLIVNVSANNVKTLESEYKKQVEPKAKPKAQERIVADEVLKRLEKGARIVKGGFAYAYQKGASLIAKGAKKAKEKIKENSAKAPKLNINTEQLKELAAKYRTKILIGTVLLGLGVKSSMPKQDTKKDKIENIAKTTSEAKDNENLASTLNIAEDSKLNKGVEALSEFKNGNTQVEENLSPEEQLKKITESNLALFDKSTEDIIVMLAFMENYAEEAFLDRSIKDSKAVPTIAFGCTKYFDENGNSSPVKMGDKMTLSEAITQVKRYLKFEIRPQIAKDVKVKLDNKRLVATVTFAYVIGRGELANSEYLQQLNKNVKGEKLGRYLLGYAKQAGLISRNYYANAILCGMLRPADFLNFRAEGCYNCSPRNYAYMKKAVVNEKLRWVVDRDKNDLGRFKNLDKQYVMEIAMKERTSTSGKCLLVSESLPQDIVQKVLDNDKYFNNSNVGNNNTQIRYLYEYSNGKNC